MSQTRNQFADLIPKSNSNSSSNSSIASPVSSVSEGNAFADLIPTDRPFPNESQITPVTKEQKLKEFTDAVGAYTTPFDYIKNLAAGLGKGGQALNPFVTSMVNKSIRANSFKFPEWMGNQKPLLAPMMENQPGGEFQPADKIDIEQTLGVSPENRMGGVQMLGEDAPLALIGPARFAKYLPEGRNIAKGLLNYGTDIVQNAGLLGGYNALKGESGTEGAIAGGAGTAIINPLIQGAFSRNPLVRIGTAGLGAAGLTAGAQQLLGTDSTTADLLGGALGAGAALRGKNARDLAVMQLLEHIDLKDVMPKIEAAKRMGLRFLRPSEATGSGYIGAIEGSVGRTPESSRLLENESGLRRTSETNSIKNLYKKIFKNEAGEDSKTVSALYTKAGESEVSPQFFNSLTESATMRSAMDRVRNNPVHQDRLGGIPITKFAYLDEVKRALDGMHSEALTKGLTGDAEHIASVRTSMIKKMDSINPQYKVARNLAERQITVRKMRKAMRSDELKGVSFYNKFFKNEEKFDDVYHSLRNAPDAQKQFTDMKLVFRDLVDSGKKNARTGVKLSETSMTNARSSGDYYQRFISLMQGGKYDHAMVELMTNPKWYEQVQRAKDMAKPDEKLRYIANLMSRASVPQTKKLIH